jgi:hypothetical protein
MKRTNFREEAFRGTLEELLEQGKLEAADSARTFALAHQWLRLQLHQANNIFPVRTSSQYKFRGSLHSIGDIGSLFMPADNEPLADLYRQWIEGWVIESTVGLALTEGKVVASWQCDQIPRPVPTMRFRGVKTSFRDRGLKLAHISDAARGVGTDMELVEQITVRFLRTLSPLNVFLFPSGRCCEFRLISSNTGWQPKTADWAEDPDLREIALTWLIGWIGTPVLDALPDFRSKMKPSPEWLRAAQGTVVEVLPKGNVGLDMRTKPTPIPRRPPSIRAVKSDLHASPQIPKALAVTVPEAVEKLRLWRRSHPMATQLDGKSGNNPAHWVHIRVDRYRDIDGFTSRHGPTFRGQDYNGVPNFHGDTTTAAIDRFIELIDLADDYHDILRPSATHETRKKKPGKPVRPKFALQGYQDRVEGFFLYHDEWQESVDGQCSQPHPKRPRRRAARRAKG